MSAVHTLWTWSPLVSCAVSMLALGMTLVNLRVYRRSSSSSSAAPGGAADGAAAAASPVVSVCIPARNEEGNIQAVVQGALANLGVSLEVIVYDDESTDRTPQFLSQLQRQDPRVRSIPTQPLPAGWNGKQWGCQRMGEAARGEWLLFTDADVRFAPDCFARSVATAIELRAALLSTVPRQETGSFLERLVIPLIHWVLLSWLPMPRMRATNDPSVSAGCGQFLLVRRDAWQAAGGHAAFRGSMHDGIKLPRNVRRAGFHTDLFDGTDIVACRMYRTAGQTWRGFTKNGYEALGSPVVLLVFTALEAIGMLLPWVWLPVALASGGAPGLALAAACASLVAQVAQRVVLAVRFDQSVLAVVLHPLSMAVLLAIQWRSWWLHVRGRRAWRGRDYAGAAAAMAGSGGGAV